MSTKQERVSYLVGWLEGFAGSAWAMCNVQEREVVCPELIAEYEDKVKELRETLKEVIYPMCDTGPYIVKTVPLVNQPTDFTPKVTFNSGEGAEWRTAFANGGEKESGAVSTAS